MFQRIANLFKGFLSLFVSSVERSSPEALLEAEKENLRSQIAKFNQGLASHAALSERLMTQVRKLEAQETQLEAKTTAHLKAGNREAAGRYALELKENRAQLEENRQQLEQAEATYKSLLRARDQSVEAAREKIERLQRGLDDLKVKKAMAELHEMAGGMVSEIGGSGDTLDRLEKMVEEERSRAAGRVRVARDSVDVGLAGDDETEQAALEDLALADFAAEKGIALASPTPQASSAEPASEGETEGTSRAMGPRSGASAAESE